MSRPVFKAGLRLIELCAGTDRPVAEGLEMVTAEFALSPEDRAAVLAEWELDAAQVAATDWEGDDYVAQEFRSLMAGRAT